VGEYEWTLARLAERGSGAEVAGRRVSEYREAKLEEETGATAKHFAAARLRRSEACRNAAFSADGRLRKNLSTKGNGKRVVNHESCGHFDLGRVPKFADGVCRTVCGWGWAGRKFQNLPFLLAGANVPLCGGMFIERRVTTLSSIAVIARSGQIPSG